jgi:hypothetical protein
MKRISLLPSYGRKEASIREPLLIPAKMETAGQGCTGNTHPQLFNRPGQFAGLTPVP